MLRPPAPCWPSWTASSRRASCGSSTCCSCDAARTVASRRCLRRRAPTPTSGGSRRRSSVAATATPTRTPRRGRWRTPSSRAGWPQWRCSSTCGRPRCWRRSTRPAGGRSASCGSPRRTGPGSPTRGRASGLADADLHLADPQQHPLPQLVGRHLGAGARDDGLHGALQVVLLQARVAAVEVHPHLGAVGLVELVVDEVDDPLQEVRAVTGTGLARTGGVLLAHHLLPSRPTVRRSLSRT